MSRSTAILGRLENMSDWLSPLVVKEVRQMVRGREFHYSFSISLVVALATAFYGAAVASQSDGTTGSGTFAALMACLTLLGLFVVPVAAFSALRTERMEQTLELVTVTALSPRRVVIGKLMAQAVKLVTLFAALAPFMAMSFLLGGIDFFTILISLGVLFLWSLWAASAFLFLSTLFKSRAMSGVVFGAAGIVMLIVLTFGRAAFFGLRFGVGVTSSPGSGSFWWGLAMVMTGCVATTVNFVLLAENRLTVPTQNRSTALRIGFFAQFLLIVAWAYSHVSSLATTRANAAEALVVLGGLHLAIVALFAVSEDLRVPRRVLQQIQQPGRWRWLRAPFMPGGGRGAAYVLVQFALLTAAVAGLDASASTITWCLALGAYICFFSGVPAYVWRRLRPNRDVTFHLRVAILVLLAFTTVLPDILYFTIGGAEVFDLDFGRRHLLNPFRTLANWSTVEASGWMVLPMLIGFAGLMAYIGLMRMGAIGAAATSEPQRVLALD